MMRSNSAILGLALMVSAVGCGTRVEIPPAHSGVLLNSSGIVEDVKGPSTFRLPVNFFGMNPHSLVILEQSVQQKVDSMSLFMPKDRMMMDFDYRGRFSISNNKEKLQFSLDRMETMPHGQTGKVDVIDFDNVWETYGDQITMTTTRRVLAKYSIEYVTKNRKSVNEELFRELNIDLASTPIACAEFGLSGVQPPALIVEAQKLAKEREVEIQSAIANKIVRITEAESALEVAKKKQMNDLLEADTQRQVGLRLTKGVNRAFVQQRALGVLQQIARSDDRIIIYPKEALENPSLMMAINGYTLGDVSTESKVVNKTPAAPVPAEAVDYQD